LLHQQPQQPPQTIEAIENGLKFIRIQSPGLHPVPNNGNAGPKDLLGTSPLANFLSSSNLVGGNRAMVPNATDVADLESRQQTMQPLHMLLKRAESHQPTTNNGTGNAVANKPALMPPTMFQSSSASASKPTATTTTTNVSQLLKTSAGEHRNPVEKKAEPSFAALVAASTVNNNNIIGGGGQTNKPEPLTQNQLIQAMNYLIKNDPDFTKKLHEAYLKSFTETITSK
jgi:mRNA-decapping enzyme C-terminus